jgi:RNA polymerase sigma factor (sigma-70 family)
MTSRTPHRVQGSFLQVEDVRLGAVEAGAAFEEFFRAEYGRLYRTLVLMVGDRSEAEDVAQEAMARVYERWERVRLAYSPAAYTYRTAFNLNRKRLRRLEVRRRKAPAPPPASSATEDAEDRAEVLRALSTLPLGQREAVLLVEYLDLDPEEAGRWLGIAPSSVRGRLHRARASLRDLLEVHDA